MKPQTQALQKRTHDFFLRVIGLCEALPKTAAARSIAEQLLDSAGSVDSNYRAACRGRSKPEFIAKIGVAVEESDESLGWLVALRDAKLGPHDELVSLVKEADELVSIFVASRKTAEYNLQKELAAKAAARHKSRRR